MVVLESLTEEDVEYNLRLKGYCLFGTENVDGKLISIEELIIRILQQKEPRNIEGILVMISKNKINYDKLINLAAQESMINPVGWILDEVYHVFLRNNLTDFDLKNAITNLFSQKSNSEYVLSPLPIPEYIEFSRQRRSELAKKWDVIARYDAASFDKKLRTYRNVRANLIK